MNKTAARNISRVINISYHCRKKHGITLQYSYNLMIALNMSPVQTEHTIEIKKIIAGGNGLGHLHDGMVVMVPFVLPGERVRISEIQRFSGHLRAEVLRIERSSPQRVEPFCTRFGTCGGCALQHTTYSNQLTIKKNILAESLERGQVLPAEDIRLPVASPDIRGYRYTIRLHIAENGRIGFHKAQSHEIVQVDHCPLAAPQLNKVLQNLIQFNQLPELAQFCSQVELSSSPADATVCATFHLSTKKNPPQPMLEKIRDQLDVAELSLKRQRQTFFSSKPLVFRQSFTILDHPHHLEWDSRCFFQVNPKQNERLVQLVCMNAGEVSGKKVLDLFCGMGNFSIPLALAGAKVTGIEHNRHAVEAAQANARNARISGSRFIAGDVAHHLQRLEKREHTFDVVVLDPPRQGLGRATGLLPGLEADRILYVSCDPATLSRDLRMLTEKRYRFVRAIPLDMFPQTHHIECLAVLEKN